jgi:hypothetical protein
MPRLPTSVLSLCLAGLLGGCASLHRPMPIPAPPPMPVPEEARVLPKPVIELIPFREGVSSATVENLAKASGCTGGLGAALITPEGPSEVYRMQCSNGRVFLARCDLRQCKPMAH